jgi:ABC-type polysaccharide/polyol phosphate export permease
MGVSTRSLPTFSTSAARPGPLAAILEALQELWSRRRLVAYLVRADLKKKGADTLLGNLWWVIDPLLQMLIYVILVSVIFARPQPDYPLFIFAAILPWKWFMTSVNDSTAAITQQDRLIKQVRFPRLVLPTAAVMAGVANFAFGLIPLVAMLVLFYQDRLSPYLVLIPVIAAVQLVFTLALGFVVAALNVFYRDVGNLSRHVLRLWFYLSPALYGASTIQKFAEGHPTLFRLMELNPFYTLFIAYRNVIYGADTPGGGSLPPLPPDWGGLGGLMVESLVLLAIAIVFFKRLEPTFAKVL